MCLFWGRTSLRTVSGERSSRLEGPGAKDDSAQAAEHLSRGPRSSGRGSLIAVYYSTIGFLRAC